MQNQTLKVLSTLTSHTVQHLLMGGQACVLYGAGQFSRDADVAVLATTENLERLREALTELEADVIAIPPFEAKYLERGLAIHFRCRKPGLNNLRIDVMSVMRGVDPFLQLWERRTTIEFKDGQRADLMNIADLVKAKKTQRDKDWPMIAELLESHYRRYQDEADAAAIDFWLIEGRTPQTLIEVANKYPDAARSAAARRPLLQDAFAASVSALRQTLLEEQQKEQEVDRIYWQPLIAELEELRHNRRRRS
jgi:hypothetical protein